VAKVRPKSATPPPLTPATTTRYDKDVVRQHRRGKDMEKLRAIIQTLCSRIPLDSRHRDHALAGEWKGWRNCHVEPDWVLIYKATDTELILGRTGTHSDLFE
jgi:mRNA interferase YafQ